MEKIVFITSIVNLLVAMTNLLKVIADIKKENNRKEEIKKDTNHKED